MLKQITKYIQIFNHEKKNIKKFLSLKNVEKNVFKNKKNHYYIVLQTISYLLQRFRDLILKDIISYK